MGQIWPVLAGLVANAGSLVFPALGAPASAKMKLVSWPGPSRTYGSLMVLRATAALAPGGEVIWTSIPPLSVPVTGAVLVLTSGRFAYWHRGPT